MIKVRRKILLVDVDSKIPNLALMRLSTYYKNKGYIVKFKKLFLSYYPYERKPFKIYAKGFSKTFISVVFTTNKNKFLVEGNNVSIGGSGYDIYVKLPSEVETCDLDYSLYPDNDISYGYITRGCNRKCGFCIVHKSEGSIHKVAEPEDIIKHKKIKFLDNNILAYDGHENILNKLNNLPIRYQFNQGLDIRLINKQNALLLSKANYIGEYIFGFDNIKHKETIFKKYALLKKYIKGDWKCKFFIYCHPKHDLKEDLLYRVKWCIKNKALPYLMRDISCWESEYKLFYTDLAAYCNQPKIVKTVSFKYYLDRRAKNKDRIKKHQEIYGEEVCQ